MRLTPSGGADRIDGVSRDGDGDGNLYLKVRVRAAPEDGKANAALEALIAKAVGVTKSKVGVVRGTTARMKTLVIEGMSEADLAAFMKRYHAG